MSWRGVRPEGILAQSSPLGAARCFAKNRQKYPAMLLSKRDPICLVDRINNFLMNEETACANYH
jgi:hypothetical protein